MSNGTPFLYLLLAHHQSVILSEAADSRRESAAQSKDPFRVGSHPRLQEEFRPGQHRINACFGPRIAVYCYHHAIDSKGRQGAPSLRREIARS